LAGNNALADLSENLEKHCARLRRELGPDGLPPCLDVKLDMPAQLLLPPALAHEALLIAREALHNVVKHSGARSAFFSAQLGAPDAANPSTWILHLELSDTGHGFDPDLPTDGFGLRGVRERVRALGGRISIDSHPGTGARLLIEIPVSERH
jgi:signal transduction histidine kinase